MKRLLHIVLDEGTAHNPVTVKPDDLAGIDITQDDDRIYLSTLDAARDLATALDEVIKSLE